MADCCERFQARTVPPAPPAPPQRSMVAHGSESDASSSGTLLQPPPPRPCSGLASDGLRGSFHPKIAAALKSAVLAGALA